MGRRAGKLPSRSEPDRFVGAWVKSKLIRLSFGAVVLLVAGTLFFVRLYNGDYAGQVIDVVYYDHSGVNTVDSANAASEVILKWSFEQGTKSLVDRFALISRTSAMNPEVFLLLGEGVIDLRPEGAQVKLSCFLMNSSSSRFRLVLSSIAESSVQATATKRFKTQLEQEFAELRAL